VRRRREDYPLNNAASAITPLMYSGVGGSTIVWGSHFPRFHPSDFRTYSLDGVGDDWPLDYAELEPYYELNDRVFGVAGLAGDPAAANRD
jgi:choline dehydrogenase-like flavoprotein